MLVVRFGISGTYKYQHHYPLAIKPQPFISFNSCFQLTSSSGCCFSSLNSRRFVVFDEMPVRKISNQDWKQGIVTILGADCDRIIRAGSIRKTLSADMSSKKWLQQNGFFSPIKKIISSQEISMAAADNHSSSSEGEEELDDVWGSIQERNPPQNGVWGSILTQKSDSPLLQPPLLFPPVKRSSSLSDRSLEICTESLGSETGSECYGDEEREDMHRSDVIEKDHFPDTQVIKCKNSPERPLPPPLPSMRTHSHRRNGRLVIEAVSVAPRNYLHAQRRDGRLVLTSMNAPTNLDDDTVEEDGEIGGKNENQELEVEENILSLATGMIIVHKLMKFVGVGDINPKWSNKGDDLLPPPAPPSAASFNVYEYFWRSKPITTNPMITNKNRINQELVAMRGSKTEQFVPYRREARRSIIWEPYCISSS